jgi:dihydroneopterin aldolase
MIEVELHGLEVFGHHGVSEEEQERGQTLLWDVAYRVDDVSEDDLSATADYVEVAQCIKDVSDGQRYRLLESLAGEAADAVLARFPVQWVRVRVQKTELGLAVEYSAATVERP